MENNKDGAVSIDTPPFLALLNNLAREYWNPEPHVPPIIAHADAHAAQRYEAGKRDGMRWYAANLDRWANRAEAAEASLARLLEALKFYADGCHFHLHDASAWDTVSGEPTNFYEDENNTATVEDGSVAKAALALLPVNAEAGGAQLAEIAQKPEIPPVGKGDAGGAEPATPAPVMGEDLPPMGERAAFEAWTRSVPCFTQFELWQAAQEQARACMALRQPGAAEPRMPTANGRPIETDAAHRLRLQATNANLSQDLRDDLRKGADECDRFYDGLMAWKRTAEEKDAAPVSQPAAPTDTKQEEMLARVLTICEDKMEFFKSHTRHELSSAVAQVYAQVRHEYRNLPAPAPGNACQPAAQEAAPDLIRMAREFAKWRLCMSYNDSYFGEPAGELKRIAREIDRVLAAAPPQPVQAELSDGQIIDIALTTLSAESNKDGGYILPISFARAILAAAKKGS